MMTAGGYRKPPRRGCRREGRPGFLSWARAASGNLTSRASMRSTQGAGSNRLPSKPSRLATIR